jgi:hypothetical protein
VFNIEENEALGFQAAGAVNILGGSFGGVQMAGAVNIVGNELAGAQMAGAANIVGGDFAGVQMAGAVNIVGNELAGAQIAGAVNIAGQHMSGVQLAGAANIARAARGLQMAGAANVAEEFSGAQIGVVNICGKGHGLQLGVVNIAEDVDVPIGLVSIVENGPFHVNVWANEFSPVNVGIKTGSNTIYNVFMFGFNPNGDSTRVFGGIGLGGHIPLNRFFVDIDVLSHGVFSGPDWFPEGGSDLLSSLRLTGGWQVTDYLAITAGPTLNVWVSDREDGAAVPFYDAPLYQWHGSENVRIWPGFTVGLQLL